MAPTMTAVPNMPNLPQMYPKHQPFYPQMYPGMPVPVMSYPPQTYPPGYPPMFPPPQPHLYAQPNPSWNSQQQPPIQHVHQAPVSHFPSKGHIQSNHHEYQNEQYKSPSKPPIDPRKEKLAQIKADVRKHLPSIQEKEDILLAIRDLIKIEKSSNPIYIENSKKIEEALKN